MRWLKLVIARLLGTTTQPLEAPAQQTQTVGLANKELTTSVGNKRSVRTTKSQPAKQKSKPKSKVAQSTKAVSSRKPKQKPAQQAVKASGANGSQPRTHASKTPQHVKQAHKRKP